MKGREPRAHRASRLSRKRRLDQLKTEHPMTTGNRNDNPISTFTFKVSAEFQWLAEQYFLKQRPDDDPDEVIGDLFKALLAHTALHGTERFDPVYALSEEAIHESEKARCRHAEETRFSFDKSEAERTLEAVCGNLSCGCEGGGWDSPIWICGLEWGGGSQEEDGTNFIDFDEYQNTSRNWKVSKNGQTRWLNAYPYNRYLVRFFTRFFNWDNRGTISELCQQAAEKGLFAPNGVGAKLNMYPFSRRDNNIWKELHIRWRGVDLGCAGDLLKEGRFLSRDEYCDKAATWRKKALLSRLYQSARNGEPKLVIGVGISSKKNFAKMFGAVGPGIGIGHDAPASTAAYKITTALDENGSPVPIENCWLIVLPFFYGGRNSLADIDGKLNPTVDAIKAFLQDQNVLRFWEDEKWSAGYDFAAQRLR